MTWLTVAWAEPQDDLAADRLLAARTASALGVPAAEVATARHCPRCGSDRHGRPVVLVRGRPSAVAASLSRTDGLVVVAIGSCASVGVDVERTPSARFDGLGPVILHAAERARSAHELAVVWVRKESLVKVTGEGVSLPFSAFRVSPPDEPARLLSWPDDGRPQVWMADLDLGTGWVGCVSVGGRPPDRLRLGSAGEEPGAATAMA